MGIWAAALAEWRDWSQRGCWDAPRFPPLAVGSGGRTKTAVRELRFVTAAARGGRGGGRRKGHGTRTGRSAGSQVGKGRSGGSGLHLARPCVGQEGTEIPSPGQVCAHTPVLGRRHPVLWTDIPPAVPPLQRAHQACTPPLKLPQARAHPHSLRAKLLGQEHTGPPRRGALRPFLFLATLSVVPRSSETYGDSRSWLLSTAHPPPHSPNQTEKGGPCPRLSVMPRAPRLSAVLGK